MESGKMRGKSRASEAVVCGECCGDLRAEMSGLFAKAKRVKAKIGMKKEEAKK